MGLSHLTGPTGPRGPAVNYGSNGPTGYHPANDDVAEPTIWISLTSGRPVGSYLRTESGVEAYDPGENLIGVFAYEEEAEDAMFDRFWSNGGDPDASEEPDFEPSPGSVPVTFLQKLRPGGPWVLIAIEPDSKYPTVVTAHTADQIDAFVHRHNGRANIYYQVNPTRTAISKKTAKTDIAAIEYVLGDLDPAKGETSEAAKARYLDQLNGGAFEPRPTAGIDSGNGIQGLWRIRERIPLGKPVVDEKGKLVFSSEDRAKIKDAEDRIAAVMRRLGAEPGTQNIDRILRLPGTTNLPNETKRRKGRVACETRLLWFDDTSYPLEVFPKEEPGKKEPGKNTEHDGRDESGSGYGYRFMQECHAKGMSYEEARAAILADQGKAGEWARRVDERQLERAWKNSKPGAAPPHSEEALALAFADRHADTIRYVANWGKWLIWDGTCWRTDGTRRVFTLARELCREIASEGVISPTERKRIASAKTRAAVVSLAGEDQRLAATTEQWDADPWLLNTPEGVVDLRTGKLREHRSGDYMTRQTAASPKGECPLWMAFLGKITGGDEALQRYLQRISGYFLTGVTTEQELYFFYGSGNNGKGVWTRAVSGILHDYHRPTRSKHSRSPDPSGIRPSWPGCEALAWSPPRRPKRVGAGRKHASRS
jgi:hypothetical protein